MHDAASPHISVPFQVMTVGPLPGYIERQHCNAMLCHGFLGNHAQNHYTAIIHIIS